jgi:hypothetical protein
MAHGRPEPDDEDLLNYAALPDGDVAAGSTQPSANTVFDARSFGLEDRLHDFVGAIVQLAWLHRLRIADDLCRQQPGMGEQLAQMSQCRRGERASHGRSAKRACDFDLRRRPVLCLPQGSRFLANPPAVCALAGPCACCCSNTIRSAPSIICRRSRQTDTT